MTFDFIIDSLIWHKTHNRQRKIHKLDFIIVKSVLQRAVCGNEVKTKWNYNEKKFENLIPIFWGHCIKNINNSYVNNKNANLPMTKARQDL